MGGALTKILEEIYFTIPEEIINLAFMNNRNQRINQIANVDEMMLSKVIRKRVIKDMDLATQETITVPIDKCEILHTDTLSAVIRIPDRVLGSRKVISAISAVERPRVVNDLVSRSSLFNTNPLLNATNKLMTAHDDINLSHSARVELVGENTIYVENIYTSFNQYDIKLLVGNDPNLTNIPPKVYKAVSKLAVYAVKSFIHINLIVKLDEGYIRGGHEINAVKGLIDDYRSAEEDYQDYYENNWKAISMMMNTDTMTDIIEGLVGNY